MALSGPYHTCVCVCMILCPYHSNALHPILPHLPLALPHPLYGCDTEWTSAVYGYLHDIASKLFRVDRETPGDRDRDPLGEGDSTSLMARWQYIVHLSQWMYNKGLLDHRDFLKSLVEFLESTMLRQHHPSDDPYRLLLPLVVQFLPESPAASRWPAPWPRSACEAVYVTLQQWREDVQ